MMRIFKPLIGFESKQRRGMKCVAACGCRYAQVQQQRMEGDTRRRAAAALADTGNAAPVCEPSMYQQLLVGSVSHKVPILSSKVYVIKARDMSDCF